MNLSNIEQSVLEHFLGHKARIVFTAPSEQSFRLSRKEVWYFKGQFINATTLVVTTNNIKNRYDKLTTGKHNDLNSFILQRLSDPVNQLVLFAPRLVTASLYKDPDDVTLGYGYSNFRRANVPIFSFLSGTNVIINLSFPLLDPFNIGKTFDFILHDARYPNHITGLPIGFSIVAVSGSVTAQMYNNLGNFDTKSLNSAVFYDYNTFSNALVAPSNTVYPIYDIETVKRNIRKNRYYF